MITITAVSHIDLELICDLLSAYGFDYTTEVYRKWVWWGEKVYRIKMEYSPKIVFLEHLLDIALSKENYYEAEKIKNLIEIKKNGGKIVLR